jgi:hypothetical protein
MVDTRAIDLCTVALPIIRINRRKRRVFKKRDARLCRDRHLDGAQAPHLMRWSVLEGIRDIIHSFAVQSRFTLLLGKSASARAGGRDFGA